MQDSQLTTEYKHVNLLLFLFLMMCVLSVALKLEPLASERSFILAFRAREAHLRYRTTSSFILGDSPQALVYAIMAIVIAEADSFRFVRSVVPARAP